MNKVKEDVLDIEDAITELETLPFGDMEFAKIDNHREMRVGYPEVVYGEGKTVEQVTKISEYMTSRGQNVLITRATPEMYGGIADKCGHAKYNALGKTITIINKPVEMTESKIVIVAAGTSDLPVVEEAYETCKMFGNSAEKIVDVGVAAYTDCSASSKESGKPRWLSLSQAWKGLLRVLSEVWWQSRS